jgi:hypothetical protein
MLICISDLVAGVYLDVHGHQDQEIDPNGSCAAPATWGSINWGNQTATVYTVGDCKSPVWSADPLIDGFPNWVLSISKDSNLLIPIPPEPEPKPELQAYARNHRTSH